MKDRRREIRIKEENKVVLIAAPGADPQSRTGAIYGLTKDLSPGGACILVDTALPLDCGLKVEIALPGSAALINARGKVKWLKPVFEGQVYEVGIEFTDVLPEDRTRLLEHIYRVPSKSR